MKKYIEIEEEVLVSLINGKYVEGSLHRDEWTGKITFKAYHRLRPKHPKNRLIRLLEHGWVKESPERIKLYESIPKDLGTTRVIAVLDRETDEARDAIVTREIIDNV